MSDWLDLDIHCTNCHKPLAGRFDYNHDQTWVLNGAYPAEVRHQDGTTQCVIIKEPQAYDAFVLDKEIRQAQARADAMESDDE